MREDVRQVWKVPGEGVGSGQKEGIPVCKGRSVSTSELGGMMFAVLLR